MGSVTAEQQTLTRLRAYLDGRIKDRPFTPPPPGYEGNWQSIITCGILHGTGRMEAYYEILQWLDEEEAAD